MTPETWVEWAIWGYVITGILMAAWMWHDSTDQKTVDKLIDDGTLDKVPTHMRSTIYYIAISGLAVVVFVAWPIVGLPVLAYTIKDRIDDWRTAKERHD